MQYLVETYDKDEKLSSTKIPDKYLLNQWLIFQMSRQGLHFGQAAWFSFYHSEQVPSAKARYSKEIESHVSAGYVAREARVPRGRQVQLCRLELCALGCYRDQSAC